MSGIRAGSLFNRVSVQARSSARDSFGEQLTTWTEIAQVRAQIETLNVSERFAASALQTDLTHQITVRYHAALWADPKAAAKLRIVYSGRYFDIRGIDNVDQRNRVVVLNVAEGLSAG